MVVAGPSGSRAATVTPDSAQSVHVDAIGNKTVVNYKIVPHGSKSEMALRRHALMREVVRDCIGPHSNVRFANQMNAKPTPKSFYLVARDHNKTFHGNAFRCGPRGLGFSV